MEGYPESGEIATLSDLELFLQRLGFFHDGILKEMHWVNSDWVDSALSMCPSQGSNLRLLIQRQFKDPSAVEIRLFGIAWMHIDVRGFIFDSSCKLSEEGLLVLQIEDCEFAFKTMSYRVASDWMGEAVRLGESWVDEIPANEN